MSVFIIIAASLFFLASLVFLPVRMILSPACAYIGLLILSFAKSEGGYPLLPINNTIITGWLCMTIIVTVATILQPLPLRRSRHGMGYIMAGGLTGLAVGLMGFSFATVPSMLYGIMIVSTAAGVFLGFLLYTNTPEGRPLGISSGNFFKYLLAKGFPTAITLMQAGVVLVLIILLHSYR